MDSWLIWKLTGGAVHATDYTNASRTLLCNIHSLQWDKELIGLFGLNGLALPEIHCSDDVFGYVADPDLVNEAVSIPICGVMGDSQAALFAQRCVSPGMVKATYGTGSSVLMNIGWKPITAAKGLVTALAWKLKDDTQYALEGIIHSSGDTLNWARDHMGLFHSYEELEEQIRSVDDTDGVYLVPAFVGLGAPYWAPNARAAITGMSRSTTRAHILRACIESIALQIQDAVSLMSETTGIPIHELRGDGGATKNTVLMQLQAELLGKTVITSKTAELSAFGAAYAGGRGIGYWTDAELNEIYQMDGCYTPSWTEERRQAKITAWRRAVGSVLG